MDTWAYELSHEQLLRKFMNVCGEAGVGTSGLVIDAMAGHNLGEAHYLRGVVLSRLEGAGMPPFKPRDRVRPKNGVVKPITGDWWGVSIPAESSIEVARVHFHNNLGVRWCLTFPETRVRDRGVPRYSADDFELVPVEAPTATI